MRVAAIAVAAGSRIRRTCTSSSVNPCCSRSAAAPMPGQQQLGSQAGDEGAIAAANVQYTGGDEGSHSFADGAATGTERLSQLGLGRQTLAGDQLAAGDERGASARWPLRSTALPRRFTPPQKS